MGRPAERDEPDAERDVPHEVIGLDRLNLRVRAIWTTARAAKVVFARASDKAEGGKHSSSDDGRRPEHEDGDRHRPLRGRGGRGLEERPQDDRDEATVFALSDEDAFLVPR